jgi:RsmE family RNA methyltransferase
LNLILFDRADAELSLPNSDPRAQHLLKILRRQVGDSFDAGVINGPRGKGTLTNRSAETISVRFDWGKPAPRSDPIHVIIGMPRPQTARDLLRDATTLGVQSLHFVATEKSDPNYARSSLWTSSEWRRQAISGAEQAFSTWIPEITFGSSLTGVIAALPSAQCRVALDNYEASVAFSRIPTMNPPVMLALGPERGWSSTDRTLLRNHGFLLAHLGERVLRAETACIAALSLIKARLGSI